MRNKDTTPNYCFAKNRLGGPELLMVRNMHTDEVFKTEEIVLRDAKIVYLHDMEENLDRSDKEAFLQEIHLGCGLVIVGEKTTVTDFWGVKRDGSPDIEGLKEKSFVVEIEKPDYEGMEADELRIEAKISATELEKKGIVIPYASLKGGDAILYHNKKLWVYRPLLSVSC